MSDVPVEKKKRRRRGGWLLLVLVVCLGLAGSRGYREWRRNGIVERWSQRRVDLDWDQPETKMPWVDDLLTWCWGWYDRTSVVYFSQTKVLGKPVVRGVGAFDFSDRDLADVAWFPAMKTLTLVGGEITDRGLSSLTSLKGLTELQISKNRITDAGLRTLCSISSLEVLDLCETEVSDAGMMELARLPRLKRVRLQGTGVTPLGAARLVKGKAGLEVSVSGTSSR